MTIDLVAGIGLGVKPQTLGVKPQNAHIRLHLALPVQEGRIAAFPHGQRLDVIGELALEVLDRVRAAYEELAPLGAIHEPRPFAQDAVLPVQLDFNAR
jgi:hypothetical protein